MPVSTILSLDRMDFDGFFGLKVSGKLYLVAKTPLPESFACLFYLQRTFGNALRTFRRSFASRVPQKSRFFLLRRNIPSYTRGILGCLLEFCRLGQHTAGAIITQAVRPGFKFRLAFFFFFLVQSQIALWSLQRMRH